jgi:hypothetical protein
MTVIDARVICVKPIVSNITVFAHVETDATFINGVYDWKDTHSDSRATEALDGKGSEINCSVPVADSCDTKRYWQTSVCTTGHSQARLVGGTKSDDGHPTLPTGHTSAQLLLNATSSM